VLIAYTDGASEAQDRRLRQFGHARLRQLLSLPVSGDLGEMVGRLRKAMADFSAGAPLSDDLTILAMHYRGQPRKRLPPLPDQVPG
jgi:sigma-B regulation protein RsbU (phosphoserine phosphatase)